MAVGVSSEASTPSNSVWRSIGSPGRAYGQTTCRYPQDISSTAVRMPKYLLTFEKGEAVRWLGHLDILRTFERAIRRAALPIAFSAGFNPRERIAFASALSTGVTGAAEAAAVEFTSEVSGPELVARLNAVLPSGIRIRTAELIPEAGSRDLLNGFDRALYELTCDFDPENGPLVHLAIDEFLKAADVTISRSREGRTKLVNIRPYVYAMEALDVNAASGRARIQILVGLGEAGAAKPNEVIAHLALTAPGMRVRRAHRLALLCSANDAAGDVTAETPALECPAKLAG